jgi:hypothetical protein
LRTAGDTEVIGVESGIDLERARREANGLLRAARDRPRARVAELAGARGRHATRDRGDERARGGRAVRPARALAQRMLADSGCRHAIVAPTPDTVPFWRLLGFVLRPWPADRTFYLPQRGLNGGH